MSVAVVRKKMRNNLKRSSGFSLIEVLVAMLILAIGLLGLMSLQLLSLQTNTNSNFRTQATIAANDMSERIRANIPGFEAGAYDAISFSSNGTECSAGCSALARAGNDVLEWKEYLTDYLPEGKGEVQNKGISNSLDIKVTWKENDKSGASLTKEFILRARFQ
jgi:type IV pilus assembly protein PilV